MGEGGGGVLESSLQKIFQPPSSEIFTDILLNTKGQSEVI